MALISVSDWLDRFGDAPATPARASELDSLRFEVTEAPAAMPEAGTAVRRSARWRDRLHGVWRRACWRLRRLPSGQA